MSKIIIINGDEEFLKEQAALDEIESNLIEEVIKFDFPNDIERFEEFLSFSYFSNKKRALLLRNVNKILDLEFNGLVIFISQNGKKLTCINSYKTYDFPRLKTYDNKNEVIDWIIKEGKRLNIDLINVAHPLFVSCGKSLYKLSSEIRKLSIVTKPSHSVTIDEMKSIVSFSAEITPQTLIDSVCSGQVSRVILLFEKIMDQNNIGWLVASLQGFVNQQIVIQYSHNVGVSTKDMSSFLGVHPFIINRIIDSRLNLWTINSLIDSYNTLFEIDRLIRISDESVNFLLEFEVIRLSEEAKRKHDKPSISK